MISPQELGRVSAALLGLTVPYTYQQALAATELGEKRLCETAQRLLLRGAFRPREEDLWRGWLGLSGPVRVSPTAGLLADESPLVASGPSPALQREQDEELEEAVSRPQRASRRPYHHTRSVLQRLQQAPEDCSYGQLLLLYVNGRKLVAPELSLGRFGAANAHLLPKHVVEMTAPNKARRVFGRLPSAPVLPELAALVSRLDGYNDRLIQLDGRLSRIEKVYDIPTYYRTPFPSRQRDLLAWPKAPLHLTRTVGRRMIAAGRAAGRALRGDE